MKLATLRHFQTYKMTPRDVTRDSKQSRRSNDKEDVWSEGQTGRPAKTAKNLQIDWDLKYQRSRRE